MKAEDVAQAHLADIGAAAKHGVQFLTYWFDPDHGEAFCLAQAPAPEALTDVHRETHGLIPNEIISVSEDNILRFLGRMNDPVDRAPAANPFRAILFTDLEGSTTLLESAGEAAYMVLLTEHDLIIRRALVATRGREVKHTGDGIMASFEDVANALDCSLAFLDGFANRVSEGDDLDRISFRHGRCWVPFSHGMPAGGADTRKRGISDTVDSWQPLGRFTPTARGRIERRTQPSPC